MLFRSIASTTTVRMAVARLEFTPSIPTLARIDVSAAKTADSIANTNHMISDSPFTQTHLLPIFIHAVEHAFMRFYTYLLLCIFVFIHTCYDKRAVPKSSCRPESYSHRSSGSVPLCHGSPHSKIRRRPDADVLSSDQ